MKPTDLEDVGSICRVFVQQMHLWAFPSAKFIAKSNSTTHLQQRNTHHSSSRLGPVGAVWIERRLPVPGLEIRQTKQQQVGKGENVDIVSASFAKSMRKEEKPSALRMALATLNRRMFHSRAARLLRKNVLTKVTESESFKRFKKDPQMAKITVEGEIQSQTLALRVSF